MGVLEVKGLGLTLGGRRILDGLSLDFDEGHVHALVGPNGAGKSTFAAAIMGLDGYRDVEGDVLLDGASIVRLSTTERARRGMTLAWQEPARYEGLKVRRFIEASARGAGEGDVREALSKAGLEPDDYLDRSVDRTLSGGERKKVELASILAMRPRVAILDEPDSGIDVESLARIFGALRYLREEGSTVVLITHSMAVLQHADSAFLMCSGRIVDRGDAASIARHFGGTCVPCGHKNIPGEEGADGRA